MEIKKYVILQSSNVLFLGRIFTKATKAPLATRNLRVVIVAPVWLQNVLSLWLQTVGKITCVTGATTFTAVDECLTYDWVIFAADQESVDTPFAVTMQMIQQRWPAARLCVFLDDPAMQAPN